MSDDDAKVVNELKSIRADMGYDSWGESWDQSMADGIALIERLSAEVDKKNRLMERQAATHMQLALGHTRLEADNAALRAEVERLTTKEMTLREACDVLDGRRHNGFRWRADEHMEGFAIAAANTDDCTEWFREPEAIWIAQGLERAAAPQEPADTKGGE